MKKHTQHKGFILTLLFFFFMSLSGCAEKPVPTSQTTNRILTEIPLRITWEDFSGRGVAIQKIIDVYNTRQDKNHKIVLQSGDENISNIESLITGADQKPILVLPYRFVKYLGDKGQLSDLSGDFNQNSSLFYPKLWDLGKVGDKVYGVPWVGHSVCLLYNKDLLRKAGIDPTQINNLSKLVEALLLVEDKTEAKGIGLVGADHNDISWMVNQFIYGFNGKLVDESGKKVALNSTEAREALTFYKDVLGAHAQPTWLTDTGVEVMTHFRKQEIAFEFQGVWGLTDIAKNGSPFEVGILNLETIGLKSEVGPLMLSIPQNMPIEQKIEAKKIITYMISVEAQESIMNGEYSPEHDAYYPFRVPVRIDLATRLVFTENPEYLPFITGFKDPSIDVPVPKWQIIKDKYYAPGLSQVMASEISIDDFLQTIEKEGNRILESTNMH